MSLHAIKDEDPTIRAKLLSRISAETIKSVVRQFAAASHTAGSDNDLKLAVQVKNFLEAHNFSRVEMKDYSVLLSLPDNTDPNNFEIIDQISNTTIYSSLKDGPKGQPETVNWTAYCAYSPKADFKVLCLLSYPKSKLEHLSNLQSQVIFVNYGRAADYQLLTSFNITRETISGKILIAKQFHLTADEQVRFATSSFKPDLNHNYFR